MSTGLTIRLGEPGDDSRIRALLARNPMPGSISIAFAAEPSFFDAIEVEGDSPQVVVCERDGGIIGVGLASRRAVYINSKPSQVGYLSSLRIDSEARGSMCLARGFEFFRHLHQDSQGPRFYLTTIMEDNTQARSVLCSGRAGLPAYHEISSYNTIAIPLYPRRAPRPAAGMSVVRGNELGAERLAQCLNKWGSEKQFYPVYSARDIAEERGLLRGLSVDDFYIVVKDGKPAGVMACWDQLVFRQNIVTGYSRSMAVVKRSLDALSRILPVPTLPHRGEPVRSVMAACIAIENDDRELFGLLLSHVLHELAGRDRSFLMLGLADKDPLAATALRYVHFTLRSRIYAAAWDDGCSKIEALDRGRVPYLELGSL